MPRPGYQTAAGISPAERGPERSWGVCAGFPGQNPHDNSHGHRAAGAFWVASAASYLTFIRLVRTLALKIHMRLPGGRMVLAVGGALGLGDDGIVDVLP
jgi:hypothetical protein